MKAQLNKGSAVRRYRQSEAVSKLSANFIKIDKSASPSMFSCLIPDRVKQRIEWQRAKAPSEALMLPFSMS